METLKISKKTEPVMFTIRVDKSIVDFYDDLAKKDQPFPERTHRHGTGFCQRQDSDRPGGLKCPSFVDKPALDR